MTANPPSRIRRLRWHGDPGEEEQPDVGDVLFEDHGKRIYVVRHARELTRGPDAGRAEELLLYVDPADMSALALADSNGATVFECRRWRRGE